MTFPPSHNGGGEERGRDWTLYQPNKRDNNFQVIPNNDSRLHEKEGRQCWCEPRIAFENGKAIIIHNAKDGRE